LHAAAASLTDGMAVADPERMPRPALAAIVVLLAPRPGWAAVDLVLSGATSAVVAAGDRVAVVQGEEVRLLSADGRLLRRLGTVGVDSGDNRAHARAQRPDDVLDLHDVPEQERDSTAADDLVDDDLTLAERRRTRQSSATTQRRAGQAPLLAAAGEEIWALAGGALWHVDARGRTARSAGLIPRLDHLAVDRDGHLVAAAGSEVWRSTDGGLTFAPIARADGPVRAVATAGGRVAWATDHRLSWADGPRRRAGSVTLPARALAVSLCGDTLLALHERGLLAVDRSDAPRAIGSTPAATRLGCDDDGGWWLIGPGLSVSYDRGRSFAAPPGLPVLPVPIADASPAARGVWVATGAGLFVVGGSSGAPPLAAATAVRAEGRARERARWASLLPRLVIAASATANRPGEPGTSLPPSRTDLRTVAYADFPLGARVPATVRAAPALALQEGGGPPPGAVAGPVPGAVAGPVPAALSALPPDPDAGCLRRARTGAVNLAHADPDRARSYIERAGRAAWLPELRLRVDHLVGRSESLDVPVGSVTGPLGLDTANDVRYEVRATWDLSRLVFSPDEIAAEGQALRMADVRRELESLVNRLYFERRRLSMDLEPGAPADAASQARRTLRGDELDAELDALSGGVFARCLAERRR
jgi:hypothetical protein